jgi:hypothetical protein
LGVPDTPGMLMIRARATKIDEYQFLTCVKSGLWGSKSARFKQWLVDDLLFFLVDNALAGYARVSGKPFKSQEPVWDNGLFPHRVPLTFEHLLLPIHRPPNVGDLRATLTTAFQADWGLGLINQWLMKPEAAESLRSAISSVPNDLQIVMGGLTQLLAEAKAQREFKPKKKFPEKLEISTDEVVEKETPPQLQVVKGASAAPQDTHHVDAQASLIALGRMVGCDVWVASNDKSKVFNGVALGSQCLKNLPNMGLSVEASKAIGLIDVIWIKKNAPLAAFEVETTTSVHSGLLRMSDLVELVPALNLDLYIVAPRDREDKVLREMARPTFRRIGLPDICRFIAIEDLQELSKKIKGLGGHINPSIIQTVSVALPDQQAAGLA